MFTLRTETGKLIANNELFTYARAATGTLTTIARVSSSQDFVSQVTLSLAGDVSPFVAISGGGGYLLALLRREFSGGTTQYFYISNAPVGTQFGYHIFGQSKDITATGGRMIVRNTSGQVTFADNHPWLLAPVLQNYSQNEGADTITVTGATSVSVLQLQVGMHYRRTGIAENADGQGPTEPGNYDVPVEYVVYGVGSSGNTANFGEVLWVAQSESVYADSRADANAQLDAAAYTRAMPTFVCNLSHI